MSDKQPFPKLSKEQMERLGKAFREISEAGDLQPRLHESFIGLDVSTYVGITFSGLPQIPPLPPSELLSYAYNGTDAYATALLSTDTLLAPNCTMTVTCELQRRDDTEDLTIRYTSTTDFLTPELWGPRMAAFLTVFAAALAAKEIHATSPLFCDKVGAPVWFAYPGKLRLSKSTMADLPSENWPRATRKFIVTNDLRNRAKNAALLLTGEASRFHNE